MDWLDTSLLKKTREEEGGETTGRNGKGHSNTHTPPSLITGMLWQTHTFAGAGCLPSTFPNPLVGWGQPGRLPFSNTYVSSPNGRMDSIHKFYLHMTACWQGASIPSSFTWDGGWWEGRGITTNNKETMLKRRTLVVRTETLRSATWVGLALFHKN